MADLFRKKLNQTIACTQHVGVHCPCCNPTKGRRKSKMRKSLNSSARFFLKQDLRNIMEDNYD